MSVPYPTDIDEFFRALDARSTEPDLVEDLRSRLTRENGSIERLGDPAVVLAFIRRLLPSELVPAEALGAVLDSVFDLQKGRADEQVGLLPRAELIPAGFAALDRVSREEQQRSFDQLDDAEQDALLHRMERGEVGAGDGFDSAYWFKRTRELVLLAYGSDPRGMVEMGSPGPSYETGHVWLDAPGIRARERRVAGYLRL